MKVSTNVMQPSFQARLKNNDLTKNIVNKIKTYAYVDNT